MDRRTSQRTFGLESDETNDYNKNNNAEDMLTKTNTGRKAASKQLDTSNRKECKHWQNANCSIK